MIKKIILFLFPLLILCNTASALMWNDPSVIPVQSISDHRWRDALTGRLINAQGMPDDYISPAAMAGTSATPTTPAAPTAPTPTSNPTPTTTTTTTTTSSTPASTSTPKKGWNSMGKAAKAGTVLAAVGGAAMVYSGTAGQQEHDGWDVASGVGGGAITGAAVGSAVPVIGTAVGAAVGAVVGGIISGSQLFSETDCLYDPIILNKEGKPTFTCCNTAFNKGERQAGIGEYMFCDVTNENGQPLAGVRQCKQGGSETELSWWDGLWEDDAWDAECKPRWCNDNKPPHDNIIPIADTKNFCWNWQSATPDTSTPDTSTPNAPTPDAPTDMYGLLIKKLQSAIYAYEKQCGKSK